MSKLQDKVYESLSDLDMHKALPGVPILSYADLGKYKTIKELLPKARDAIILFVELQENIGHWQALTRSENNIYFFDSYGTRPDKALLWIDKYMRKELNEQVPYVSYLLNEALSAGFNVSFNSFRYQNKKQTSISTCGRWCIAWVKWNKNQVNNSPKAFNKYIKKYSKDHELNYDLSISQIIP